MKFICFYLSLLMAFLDHGACEIYLSIFWGFSKTEGVPLLRGVLRFSGRLVFPMLCGAPRVGLFGAWYGSSGSGFLFNLCFGSSVPLIRDPRLLLATLHRWYSGRTWGAPEFVAILACFWGRWKHCSPQRGLPTSITGIHGSQLCFPQLCLLRIVGHGL